MKKVLYKILMCFALFVPFVFVGCSLDENLYGVTTTEKFIETEADIPFVVNGVYATYQDFSSYKSCAHSLIMYSGDDLTAVSVSTGFSAGLFLSRKYTSDDTYIRNAWEYYYKAIDRANSAMKAVAGAPSAVTAETKKRVIGEMYFVRGFTYFNLVRLFGGVPIRTEATTPDEELYLTRASVDKVYERVFADLKRASEDCIPLSLQPASEWGRATKGAADAMLSLAYLTYASYCDMNGRTSESKQYYEFALEYADDVLTSGEYSLVDDYANLFDVATEKDAYKEVIFGIQFTRDELSSGAGSRGSELAYYFQPSTKTYVCGNPTKGKGAGHVRVQPWFVKQYLTDPNHVSGTELDYRAEFTFLTKWVGEDSKGVAKTYITYPVVDNTTGITRESYGYLNKYTDAKGRETRNNENDLFIIRLSEVYLIKAEALNELDRTSEAYEPFNELRKRARKANGTARTVPIDLATGLTKEDFRMAVFNERGLELVGEGHRWFDAIRMRYGNTTKSMLQWRFDTFYANMTADEMKLPSWNYTTKQWNAGKVSPATLSDWSERYMLFPIPAKELSTNPKFGKPNPGW